MTPVTIIGAGLGGAASAAEAHRMLALCLDARPPFGLVEFFTGAFSDDGMSRPAIESSRES